MNYSTPHLYKFLAKLGILCILNVSDTNLEINIWFSEEMVICFTRRLLKIKHPKCFKIKSFGLAIGFRHFTCMHALAGTVVSWTEH